MFTIDQLIELFPFDYLYLDTRLNRWFEFSFSELRKLIKAGCLDWQTIKTFTDEQMKIFRGRSPNEIKKLLLKSKRPTVDLSNAIGLVKIYTKAMYKISQFFTGQDMWAQDLQRYVRREEAIKLLKEGVDPHIILDRYFELNIWKTKGGRTYLDKYKMRYNYEQYLFRESNLTFEQIVEAYYNNPGNILNRYRDGNVVLKD